MTRKDERFQVYIETFDSPPVAESSSLNGAMRFAQQYAKYGRLVWINDRRAAKRYTPYGALIETTGRQMSREFQKDLKG